MQSKPGKPLFNTGQLTGVFLALVLTQFCIKLFMATELELFGDGAFYWLESKYLAPAYSDIPFVTAFLVKLGTLLLGDSLPGTRLFFLVLGSALPLLVYWVCNPICGKRNALIASILSLATPVVASMGVLAVPDVPLQCAGIIALGFFERAIRTNQNHYWIALAIVGAIGFSTHYRFVVLPFCLFMYLILDSGQRHHLANPKALLAGLFSLCGLIPVIWFNTSHDWQGVSFHFSDRHPGQFHTRGLFQPLVQSLLLTPWIYACLLLSAIWALRQKNSQYRLLAITGLCYLLIFALAAPWADKRSSSAHWPLTGYLPLLALLPAWLDQLPRKRTVSTLYNAFGYGALLCLLAYGYLAANYHLIPLKHQAFFTNKFDGHQQLYEELKISTDPNAKPLVTDHYYLGALMAFYKNNSGNIYFLNHEKAHRDGRNTQIHLWQKYASYLKPGTEVSILIELNKLNHKEMIEVEEQICDYFEDISTIKTISQFEGEKRYKLLSARRKSGPTDKPAETSKETWCDGPVYYDISPYPGEFNRYSKSENLAVSGWAYQPHFGIKEINVVIDGKLRFPVKTGISRLDVVKYHSDSALDSNSPYLGVEFSLPLQELEVGWHHMELEITSLSGNLKKTGYTRFYVTDDKL